MFSCTFEMAMSILSLAILHQGPFTAGRGTSLYLHTHLPSLHNFTTWGSVRASWVISQWGPGLHPCIERQAPGSFVHASPCLCPMWCGKPPSPPSDKVTGFPRQCSVPISCLPPRATLSQSLIRSAFSVLLKACVSGVGSLGTYQKKTASCFNNLC